VTRANVHFWDGKLDDWTRWFDMHPLTPLQHFNGIMDRRPEAWAWYRRQDGSRPIYLQGPHWNSDPELAASRFAQIPGGTEFPIERLVEKYTPKGEPLPNYLCQVGMMMCFALDEGFDHIILNGIGTVNSIEHQHLHRDIGYWVGFARGQGVQVDVEGPSCFKSPSRIYGYQALYADELMEARRQALLSANGMSLESITKQIARDIRRGRPPKFKV
jgi:hypothetical protein